MTCALVTIATRYDRGYWFAAIHICLMLLAIARAIFSKELFFTLRPFFMELQELYDPFLEADQERNDRVTHYTHYGEQICTTSTSQ